MLPPIERAEFFSELVGLDLPCGAPGAVLTSDFVDAVSPKLLAQGRIRHLSRPLQRVVKRTST
jgi:hypothetical protein